jgi:hypothetical protein
VETVAEATAECEKKPQRAGESGMVPGRLRMDLAEAVLCNVERVGETRPLE